MNISKRITTLENKLAKLQHTAYLNTKKHDFSQQQDQTDWNKREPVIKELRLLKAAQRVLVDMDSQEEPDYTKALEKESAYSGIDKAKLENVLNDYI
jgi:hypothetical protein